jgi:hypothetical protein
VSSVTGPSKLIRDTVRRATWGRKRQEMSNYTVRIELHGAKHEDKVYDDLHDKMRSHRFRRTFTDKGA